MSPRWRRRLAAGVVVVTLVGWPVSALSWARQEPQFILALSWIAIAISAADVFVTTDVRVKQEREDG